MGDTTERALTPETLREESAVHKQHPELGCYSCGEPLDAHAGSCLVPVVEAHADAWEAENKKQAERIRELERERVAYYAALTKENPEVVQRVTRSVIDTRGDTLAAAEE